MTLVIIAGKPNVGKSTLFNRMTSLKLSSTSHVAHTTKELFSWVKNGITYVDTPGYKYLPPHVLTGEPKPLVLLVTTPGSWSEEDVKFLHKCNVLTCKVVLIVNKVDTASPETAVYDEFIALSKTYQTADVFFVSAKHSHNLKLIDRKIKQLLHHNFTEDIKLPDSNASYYLKWRIKELVRETLFRYVGDEIPHQAVVSVDLTEKYIVVDIAVKKVSQKKIIIGAKGSNLGVLRQKITSGLRGYLNRHQTLLIHVKHTKNS